MSDPLPSFLEVPPMLTVEANQVAEDERWGGLEWTSEGQGRGGDDEDIEEETECGKTNEDAGNNFIDEVEVVGERTAEEEESSL